jgi:hypothetical protein
MSGTHSDRPSRQIFHRVDFRSFYSEHCERHVAEHDGDRFQLSILIGDAGNDGAEIGDADISLPSGNALNGIKAARAL